eukprot:s996_g26.t1
MKNTNYDGEDQEELMPQARWTADKDREPTAEWDREVLGLQICDQVSCFLDKPKVFVAGSTGELGRRAVLDMLRTGMSIYCGVRDEGRMYEVQYKNRSSSKYEMTVIPDAFIEGGREQALEEQLCDASVVVDVAGARFGLDILRLGSGILAAIKLQFWRG